jgi:general secretion pathway protein K
LKGERGFALVITLIITALLVALCAEFVNEVFVDTSATRSFTDGQQASLLAQSGTDAAINLLKIGQGIRNQSGQQYTSQADLDQLAKLLHIEDETGAIQVTVEDESGKLNINKCWGDNGASLPPYSDMAGRMIKNIGLTRDLLDSIADWRDLNDEPRAGGAENTYYGTLKPPYSAKNGKLSTVEELRLVKWVDPVALKRLQPLITVYDDCNFININTAPAEVVAALAEDMSDNLAAKVVDYRKNKPFKNLGDDLKNVPGMTDRIVQSIQGIASVKGMVFRIHSEAKMNETIRIVEAVVNSNWQILYWREY